MQPDFKSMTPEQYVTYLERQRVVVNLERSEHEKLVNSLEKGFQTQEEILREVEQLKTRKLSNALSEIGRILDSSESESERIKKAKAAVVRVLLVPSF